MDQINQITCTECFRSLGVPTKYKMYSFMVAHGSATVSELVAHVGLRQPTVSHHLTQMFTAGLLSRTKKGKQVYYSIKSWCPHDGTACVLQGVKLKHA